MKVKQQLSALQGELKVSKEENGKLEEKISQAKEEVSGIIFGCNKAHSPNYAMC